MQQKMAIDYDLRAPMAEMNIVPGVHASLTSACKIEGTGYVTVLSKEGLNIYDGTTCKIMASKAAILSRWQNDKGLL